jgi:transposase
MNSDVFEQWLTKNISDFRKIAGPRKIVLVMDNAPYHGRIRNKVPRARNAKKQLLIDFLETHGVDVPVTATKAILDGLIENYLRENPCSEEKEVEVVYCLRNRNFCYVNKPQKICRENGVHLLRLPPYHCLFNPIETLWGHMKREVREAARPDSKLSEVRTLAFESLKRTGPEVIQKFFKHVENVEEEFRVKEGIRNVVIEPIIIPVEDFDDEDSESDAEIDVVGSDDDDI